MRIETIHCDGCGVIQASTDIFATIHIIPPSMPLWRGTEFRLNEICRQCVDRVIDALPVVAVERQRRILNEKEQTNVKSR